MNMHLGSVLILHGGEWKNLKIPYSVSKNTSKFSEIKFNVKNLLLETYFLDKIIFKVASLLIFKN